MILYATETGTAQDSADNIARACRLIHFSARVSNMATYVPVRAPRSNGTFPFDSPSQQTELVSEHLVVFVLSTTDSGVEPRSMTPLWNMLLRSDLPDDLFDELDYAVFGLGDSSYERFCWPAKKLSRRLKGLGANEICAVGEGDEQHSLGCVARSFLADQFDETGGC